MPRSSKRTLSPAPADRDTVSFALPNPLRAGLPSLDSIRGQATLGSLRGAYRVLKTDEIDAYELGRPLKATLAPPGDTFQGTARKAAKLSIATATTETFSDLKQLVDSLPSDSVMASHKPKIKTTTTSNRIQEEKRNIRVDAFIYAASRENDNDFHLIVGRDPHQNPEMYLTMELSGLPPKSSASYTQLKAARDAYKQFFGTNLPGATYDFYDPPVPVRIDGSLFFDMSHAKGARPGPQSLKSRMPTIWEVHPITTIVFEP